MADREHVRLEGMRRRAFRLLAPDASVEDSAIRWLAADPVFAGALPATTLVPTTVRINR